MVKVESALVILLELKLIPIQNLIQVNVIDILGIDDNII